MAVCKTCKMETKAQAIDFTATTIRKLKLKPNEIETLILLLLMLTNYLQRDCNQLITFIL